MDRGVRTFTKEYFFLSDVFSHHIDDHVAHFLQKYNNACRCVVIF